MSTANGRWHRFTAIEVDRWGVLLASLFLVVLVGSVALASWVASFGTEPVMSGSSSSAQAAGGAGWAAAEVVVALSVLGLFLLWQRLPEWVQDVVKTGLLVTGAMVAGAQLSAFGPSAVWEVAAVLVGYYTIIQATDAFDVYWLWNDLEAIVVAIAGAAVVGVLLPLPFLLVGIVGLTIYDHVFANKSDWMFTIGEGMLRAKLPVVVFAFPTLRVPWETICAAVGGDDDAGGDAAELFNDRSGFGIGMADLLLPASFAVAVSLAGGGALPAVGVAAGVIVAAFRLRWEMINIGGGAGLPALTTGMVGGWVLASMVVLPL